MPRSRPLYRAAWSGQEGPIPVLTEPWLPEESVFSEMFLRTEISVQSGAYPAQFGQPSAPWCPVRCRFLAPSDDLSLPAEFRGEPEGSLPKT